MHGSLSAPFIPHPSCLIPLALIVCLSLCLWERTFQDVGAYLAASEEQQFDLVVAAETLQYLGPLGEVVADAFKVLKPGGYFSFTVDRRRTREEGEDKGDEGEEEGRAEGGRKDQVGGARAASCAMREAKPGS